MDLNSLRFLRGWTPMPIIRPMKSFPIGALILSGLFTLAAPGYAGVDEGDKAPALNAKTMEGPLKSLNQTKGKVVLYKFFAFW